MMLFRLVFPNACFGGMVEDGRVTAVAPMGRWMMGKRIETVERWAKRKKIEFSTWTP